MDKLVVWGATGQALVINELIQNQNIEIDVFFDENRNVLSPISKIPIFHNYSEFLEWIKLKNKKYKFVVAIGGEHGKVREEVSFSLESNNLVPFQAIHKTAFIADDVKIGKGCQILVNSTICTKSTIGNYSIINTSSSIDHECVIGNGVHIGPGAILAGCVDIEDYAFIGSNATILPRIRIGKNSIIGAGSVVTKDVPENSIVYGNPARIIKTLKL
jgi:sugar O-acyltransferase (sialic acid O-acetyltransferase NeuD family)